MPHGAFLAVSNCSLARVTCVAVREAARLDSTIQKGTHVSAEGSVVLKHRHGKDVRPDTSASRAREQLSAIASELLARREAILEAWRAAGEPAAERGIASSLSRAQFNDHIPAVLDCLAHTIEAWPDEQTALAGQIQSQRVCDHGLQRWQQGYQLRELIREWGHLQICVADELERYAGSHPGLEPGVMPTVRRAWVQLCADGVTDSATQY